MTHWFTAALAILKQNKPAAMITVAEVSGSAPREAGTHMIVTSDTQWGTIGGGNLEFQAVSRARALLEEADVSSFVDDYPLGPQLRQCCGGFVRVLTSRLTGADRSWLEQIERGFDAGKTMRFEIAIGADTSIRYAVSEQQDGEGATPLFLSTLKGGAPSAGATESLIQRIAPPSATVYLFGAGHVGQAVAHVLGSLPVRVVWIDSREDYLPKVAADNTTVRLTGDLVTEVQGAAPGSFFLIFTHSHDLDYEVVKAVLLRDDFGYCGLIGSRTKRASFEGRLRDDGVSEQRMGRLVCPIGMKTLKSKDPNVIAIGVVAELMTYVDTSGEA